MEIAAALAAEAARRGDRFGLSAGAEQISAGSGPAQLDRVLDALARVSFPTAAAAAAVPGSTVWIGTGAAPGGFADAFVAGRDG